MTTSLQHDGGFRILARKQGERVQVWSRSGADFTDRFPRIAEAVRGLPADEATVEGEAPSSSGTTGAATSARS